MRYTEPILKKNMTPEEEISFNILNFISTIHLNGDDFIESVYDSKFFGDLPMSFSKKSGQVVGIITAEVKGKIRRYVFNDQGYENLDELLRGL